MIPKVFDVEHEAGCFALVAPLLAIGIEDPVTKEVLHLVIKVRPLDIVFEIICTMIDSILACILCVFFFSSRFCRRTFQKVLDILRINRDDTTTDTERGRRPKTTQLGQTEIAMAIVTMATYMVSVSSCSNWRQTQS